MTLCLIGMEKPNGFTSPCLLRAGHEGAHMHEEICEQRSCCCTKQHPLPPHDYYDFCDWLSKQKTEEIHALMMWCTSELMGRDKGML